MGLHGVTAVQPSWNQGPQTAEEALSGLKWLEAQATMNAKEGRPSDSLHYLANLRDAAIAYKLTFPDYRIGFGLIAAEAERLRIS